MKLVVQARRWMSRAVAPPVGAWIEIWNADCVGAFNIVAPPVGAWIEISISIRSFMYKSVAPPVGAWIEISFFAQDTPPDGVAPLAEGELKKVNLELLVSSNALM